MSQINSPDTSVTLNTTIPRNNSPCFAVVSKHVLRCKRKVCLQPLWCVEWQYFHGIPVRDYHPHVPYLINVFMSQFIVSVLAIKTLVIIGENVCRLLLVIFLDLGFALELIDRFVYYKCCHSLLYVCFCAERIFSVIYGVSYTSNACMVGLYILRRNENVLQLSSLIFFPEAVQC